MNSGIHQLSATYPAGKCGVCGIWSVVQLMQLVIYHFSGLYPGSAAARVLKQDPDESLKALQAFLRTYYWAGGDFSTLRFPVPTLHRGSF